MNYIDQLERQLGFLDRSCRSYDAGYEDESIRIATIIRVLIHNTPQSTSLLQHLNATNIKLLSTSMIIPDESIILFFGMGTFSIGKNSQYSPSLDNSSFKVYLESQEWWNQVVYVLNPSTKLSRKSIVLSAANKDGGAHVDPNISKEYEALISDGALGVIMKNNGQESTPTPITNAHLVALRQMGHELLNSPELLKLIEQ